MGTDDIPHPFSILRIAGQSNGDVWDSEPTVELQTGIFVRLELRAEARPEPEK